MLFSSLAYSNLREYMTYTMDMSGWENKKIGNLLLTLNGRRDSNFNYVFRLDGTQEESEKSAMEAINFLTKEGIDTTWVADSHEKWWEYFLVNKVKMEAPTISKKTFFRIPKKVACEKENPNLVLEVAHTDEALMLLDELAGKIFYCNSNDLVILLKGINGEGQSRLRFFIARLFGVPVGMCAMYVQGEVVGLYSDGVLGEYRNRGIASEMVLRRLRMASEEFGCKYAVTQCLESSVNLYKRLGFKIMGNLFLFPSVMS